MTLLRWVNSSRGFVGTYYLNSQVSNGPFDPWESPENGNSQFKFLGYSVMSAVGNRKVTFIYIRRKNVKVIHMHTLTKTNAVDLQNTYTHTHTHPNTETHRCALYLFHSAAARSTTNLKLLEAIGSGHTKCSLHTGIKLSAYFC